MRRTLKPHPDTPAPAFALAVEAVRLPEALALRYCLTGEIDNVLAPAPASPARADHLWKRTCFEAFLKPRTSGVYYELNFSPSTQWAAYRFSAYREGMAAAQEFAAPAISLKRDGGALVLEARLELPPSLAEAALQLGLSAVIEEQNGAKSYWAFAHPPGRPDFHHPVCFVGELP